MTFEIQFAIYPLTLQKWQHESWQKMQHLAHVLTAT
jgi:hypothetical protein